MKRRTRSSLGPSRGGALRAPLLCLTAALGLTAAACSSDLFHSTKWQSRCDVEPDAAICPQGTGGAGGGSSSASTTGGAGGAGGGSSASTTGGAGGAGGAGSSTSSSSATTAAASSSTG